MYAIEIIFKEGAPARFKDVESFYYDPEIQCFIAKDPTGIGYFPRETINMIFKKEPSDASETNRG